MRKNPSVVSAYSLCPFINPRIIPGRKNIIDIRAIIIPTLIKTPKYFFPSRTNNRAVMFGKPENDFHIIEDPPDRKNIYKKINKNMVGK